MRLALLSVVIGLSSACSWFSVNTLDGKHVIGRTMEIHGYVGKSIKDELPSNWGLKKVPKGTPITPSKFDSGKRCALLNCKLAEWFVQYSHIGVGYTFTTEGPDTIFDGINTEGLTVDLQTLRQAGYQLPPVPQPPNAIVVCFTTFTAYLLANYATVPEVIAALEDKVKPIYVVAPQDGYNGDYYHWVVTDKYRESVVIEYVKGLLHIHNNTVRIMTNDPPFDWHLQNLQNYINLNVNWSLRPEIMVNTEIGPVPLEVNHGHNLLGIPGDFTPASRFVRLFYLRQYAETNIAMHSVPDAISLVTGLLNSVHMPKGVVAFAGGSDSTYDYTQYTSMKCPQSRTFYFRTYDDMQWQMINLDRLKFDKYTVQTLYAFNSGPRDVTQFVGTPENDHNERLRRSQ